MNIIANDCVGARIYQQLGLKYPNPFMWCLVPPESFSYLYENFDKIDFENFELVKDGEWYKIVIDGAVDVYYPHYRYDGSAKTPVTAETTGIDVYYNKIDEYIIEKYKTRLKRCKEKPLFVINDTRTKLVGGKCTFFKEDVIKYIDKSNAFILTADKTITGANVLYKPKNQIISGDAAKIILKKIGNKK